MGYILLSPEHIEFTDEKEDKNWHLFKAKKSKGEPDLYQQMKEIACCEEEYSVNIIDDDCLPECKEEVKGEQDININSKYYKSIPIEYNLKKGTIKYNLIEKLEYFTNENQTFFYSDNEDTIRMLACLLRRNVCGRCMATLYADNKK